MERSGRGFSVLRKEVRKWVKVRLYIVLRVGERFFILGVIGSYWRVLNKLGI